MSEGTGNLAPDWLGPEVWAGAPPPALLAPVIAQSLGDFPLDLGDFVELGQQVSPPPPAPPPSLLGEDWHSEADCQLFPGS